MRRARLVAENQLADDLHLFALDRKHGDGSLDAVGDQRRRAGPVGRDAGCARAGAQAGEHTWRDVAAPIEGHHRHEIERDQLGRVGRVVPGGRTHQRQMAARCDRDL